MTWTAAMYENFPREMAEADAQRREAQFTYGPRWRPGPIFTNQNQGAQQPITGFHGMPIPANQSGSASKPVGQTGTTQHFPRELARFNQLSAIGKLFQPNSTGYNGTGYNGTQSQSAGGNQGPQNFNGGGSSRGGSFS